MEPITFKVTGKRNLELACVKVEPKKEPKAVLHIFHGMGEYKDRYIPFMKHMAQNGYAAYAHDYRQHGESLRQEETYGVFGKEDKWDDILDDCHYVTRQILRDHPGKPIIVMGHSLGSVVAIQYLARNPLTAKAAIIMGAMSPFPKGRGSVLKFIAKFLAMIGGDKRSNFLAETANNGIISQIDSPKTKFDWLTYNEENVAKYIEDPLCGYAYNARFYIQMVGPIVNVNASKTIMKIKEIPIMFISGQDDPVGNMGAGVKEIFDAFSGHGFSKITLKLVENARHEVLHENNKQETFDYLKEWCDSVIK